jgi:plastocyanin
MMSLKRLSAGLILCGLLSLLVSACAIYDVGASPTGPMVHMGAADFLQPSVTIQRGDMLTLVDDATSTHIIQNGSWVNGVAKPGKEPGAPTVNQTYYGNDSASIGPFNTPGTYHLYCTIHPGMNLTVIVK